MKHPPTRLRAHATSTLLAEIRGQCTPGENLADLIQRKPGIIGSRSLDREERSLTRKLQWAFHQIEVHCQRVTAVDADLADIAVIREARVRRRPSY